MFWLTLLTTMAAPDSPVSKQPRRRMRNFLLDYRFQLKYTGMVIFVTLCVAVTLGLMAYDYSQGQTESMTVQMLAQGELSPETVIELKAWARAEDRRVLVGIGSGILLLVLVLGLTGIVVTHRVVGPVYRVRQLLRAVEEGSYVVDQRLRRKDEFQDLFAGFLAMTKTLRTRSRVLAERLDEALTGNAGDAERWEQVREVRNELLGQANSEQPPPASDDRA